MASMDSFWSNGDSGRKLPKLSTWMVSSTGRITRIIYTPLYYKQGKAVFSGFTASGHVRWKIYLPPDAP